MVVAKVRCAVSWCACQYWCVLSWDEHAYSFVRFKTFLTREDMVVDSFMTCAVLL